MKNKKQSNFRYRMTYSRTGAMSFVAHLDLMRNFQYSCRRAKIPIAHTMGYNPRPIMEFALPVGVGIETRQDPLDIELTEKIQSASLMERLNEKLPAGLRIETAKFLDHKVKSLMRLVESASYTIKADGVGAAAEKVLFSNSEPIIVERIRKGKTRQYDLRDLIIELNIITPEEVKLLCKAGSSSNLRPDMLLKALHEAGEITKITALNAIIIRDKVYLNTED